MGLPQFKAGSRSLVPPQSFITHEIPGCTLPFARELKVETRCGKTAMSSSEQLVEQLALWTIHGHELQWDPSSARAMDTLTALKPTL